MALFIDFNFINIRDLIDLSEVDVEFENQLQELVEQVFENAGETISVSEADLTEAAISFLSDAVADAHSFVKSDVDALVKTETANKDVAKVIAAPVKPGVSTTTSKTSVNKNDAYIKYINSKYEQNQAEYFINILLNPMQTHLRNRFDYADSRNRYLQNQILGKDKDTEERKDEKTQRHNEKMRTIEEERRIEASKRFELHRLFELKNKEQYRRV